MIDRLPRIPLAVRCGIAAVAVLAALGVTQRAHAANAHVSGSVYVDYWSIPNSAVASQAPSGVTPEGALKLTADINDNLGFWAKA